MRFLVDTNVFLYARGQDHPYREPCRAVLRAAAQGDLELEASVEMVQEFTHVLLRRGVERSVAIDQTNEVRSQCKIHPFDVPVLDQVTALLGRHPRLGVRDAVHLATAVRSGLTVILSTDRIFDSVDEVTRVDPTALR
jgi:uncharacterized protein